MGSLGEWRQPVKDSVEPSPQYLALMRVLMQMSLRVAFWQLPELSTSRETASMKGRSVAGAFARTLR